MTVPYSYQGGKFTFLRPILLLFRWKGSIWKSIWPSAILFTVLYVIYYLIYIFAVTDDWVPTMSAFSQTCYESLSYIPITLVVAFYAQRALDRFFVQFNNIPWPHRLAQNVAAYVRSSDDTGRMVRRTIMRYVCLSIVLAFCGVSTQAAKRFHTLTHLRNAGFLAPSEIRTLKSITASGNKYVIPISWATNIILMARKMGLIKDDLAMLRLLTDLVNIRRNCSLVLAFDLYTIPLVYTQVVTLSVILYLMLLFLANLNWGIGSPVTDIFNVFSTVMPLILFFGWLKVAEEVTNPFGEDDDDFEVNMLIDRFLHESYMIVDELYDQLPETLPDIHIEDPDALIPYTFASKKFKHSINLTRGLKDVKEDVSDTVSEYRLRTREEEEEELKKKEHDQEDEKMPADSNDAVMRRILKELQDIRSAQSAYKNNQDD